MIIGSHTALLNSIKHPSKEPIPAAYLQSTAEILQNKRFILSLLFFGKSMAFFLSFNSFDASFQFDFHETVDAADELVYCKTLFYQLLMCYLPSESRQEHTLSNAGKTSHGKNLVVT